jgi:hypothetical protein
MKIFRRWSCRIVGLYSNRQIELRFCRFYTEAGAKRFADRLNRQVPPTIERVTEVEIYRLPWSQRDRWMLVGAVVGAFLGALAAALVLSAW